MTPEQITALFTRPDGSFLCARWGRPVAPVIFGLADESLDIFRSAIRAGFAHAGHPITDADPEMASNFMLFFLRDWDELDQLPDFEQLVGTPGLPARLHAEDAAQYRLMRFDPDGGIRAAMAFFRMTGALAEMHPARLAEEATMRATLSFARDFIPTADMAALIRAAYDPVLPVAARDPAHALRLAARLHPPDRTVQDKIR